MAQELTLFGDLFGEEETKGSTSNKKKTTVSEEEKKKSSTKPKTTSSAVKKVEKKEDIKVHGDWTVHFATESFCVSDFVEEIPEEGISLDVLREAMERVFPQFSKARTKWDLQKEQKRLFPDAFAGSKGAISSKEGGIFAPSFFITKDEALKSNKRNRYLVSGNGKLMRVCDSVFGTMIAESDSIPYLPVIKPSFNFALPKIPNILLKQIISFFRAFLSEDARYEVLVRIYWDKEEEQYVVDVPVQTVTPVNVFFEHSNQFTGVNSLRYVPVAEIHSHNVMRAFFSSTDDENEQSYCIYGVFGKLNQHQFETEFRVKCGDSEVKIMIDEIFEVHEDDLTPKCHASFPTQWLANVTMKGGRFE